MSDIEYPELKFKKNRYAFLGKKRIFGKQVLLAEQVNGFNRYEFWPRLNIAIFHNNQDVFSFVDKHFFQLRSAPRRWLLRVIMLAARFVGPFIVPAYIYTQIKCDVLVLGDTLIAIDLVGGDFSKRYTKPWPRYVDRMLSLNSILPCPANICRDSRGFWHTVPICSGVPVNRKTNVDGRILIYRSALECIASANNGSKSEKTSMKYLHELKSMIPDMFKFQVFEKLLNAIDKRLLLVLVLTHGDLKDQNILVYGDEVSLIDWELADFRNQYHDLFNLIIHPVVHGDSLLNAGVHASDTLIEWSRRLAPTACPDDENAARQFLLLTLVEKFVLYTTSGRWRLAERQCVYDLKKAMGYLNKRFDLGLY